MAGIVRMTILANAAKARAELNGFADTANSSMGRVKGILGTAGKYAAVGAGLAGAAAVAFGVKAVKSASDAQQSLGATQTVFGKYAQTVIDNSNKAARAVGLSANEYRELSNVSGALLAGAGTPLKKVAGLTDDLNKRAADMAATFGGTTREAVESISPLLKGEADPIEKYGVSIKQSDVNARLAAKGLDGLTGSALKQAEQQERLSLLFEKTGKTQGAFSRESGTLAHQQQVLGAQFENIKANVGTALLPVVTAFFAYINDTVIPVVTRLIPGLKAWASEMGDRLSPIISAVAGFVTGTLVPAITAFVGYVVGTVVPAVVAFAQKIGTNLAPVVTALAGHVQRVIAKFQDWAPTIAAVIVVVAKIIAKVVEFASVILGTVLPPLIRFASFLEVTVISAVVSTIGVIARIVSKVAEFGGAVIDGAQKVGEFAGKVRDKISDVVGFFTGLPGKITGALSGAGTMLVQIGQNIVSGLVNGLNTAKQWVIDKIREIADVIPDWIARRLGIASPSKVTTWQGRMAGQGLVDGVTSMRGKISEAAQKAADKVTEGIKRRLDNAKGVRDSITSLRDTISSALTGDLFSGADDESGSALDKFRAQLESARAMAEKVRAATAALIGKGVSGAVIEKLTANPTLLLQVAGADDAKALADSYASVLKVNDETGRLVAEEVIGTRLDDVSATIKDLVARLDARDARDAAERREPVSVKLTSEQLSRLERGREIQMDLDAYKRAGGRTAA